LLFSCYSFLLLPPILQHSTALSPHYPLVIYSPHAMELLRFI
jgi:hypothetical protein